METLIHALEVSVQNNGAKTPVTLGHLLNIVKLAHKNEQRRLAKQEKQHYELLKQINPLGQD